MIDEEETKATTNSFDDSPRRPLPTFNCAVKMSLKYGVGGATTALAVVGACEYIRAGLGVETDIDQICSSLATEKLSTYVRGRQMMGE